MTDVLDWIFGVPTIALLVVTLIFKIIENITSHSVLLSGHQIGLANDERSEADSSSSGTEGDDVAQRSKQHRYRLRMQSLEGIALDQKVDVTILGFSTGRVIRRENDGLLVAAGWTGVSIEEIATEAREGHTIEEGVRGATFAWRVRFADFPALDSWSFDVVAPCDRIQMLVSVLGSDTRRLFIPSVGPHIFPNTITVFSTDSDQPKVAGPVALPTLVLPFALSLLAALIHYFWAAWQGHWTLARTLLTSTDWIMMAGEFMLIWIGYAFIRRRVHPVIQGYRYVTAWTEKPAQNSGLEGASTTPAR